MGTVINPTALVVGTGDRDQAQQELSDRTSDGCPHSRRHGSEQGDRTRPVRSTTGQRNLRASSLLQKRDVCFPCQFHLNSSKSKLEQFRIPSHWGCLKLHRNRTHPHPPVPKSLLSHVTSQEQGYRNRKGEYTVLLFRQHTNEVVNAFDVFFPMLLNTVVAQESQNYRIIFLGEKKGWC